MKTTILDVRTPEEFRGGNVLGSINIPLHEIQQHINKIKSLPQPIILCCASGGRSGQATAYLKNLGVNCQNGGGWMEVNTNYQNI
jgi:phage shock protein E